MKSLFEVIQEVFFLNQNTQSTFNGSSQTNTQSRTESDLKSSDKKQVDCNYSNDYYGDQYCQVKVK